MLIGKWYVTAAAMREYLLIAGLKDDDGGPIWGQAEREIAAHSEVARQTDRTAASGAEIWRTGRVTCGTQLSVRLEMYVMRTPRPEGPLPQLIHIQKKGQGGRARH